MHSLEATDAQMARGFLQTERDEWTRDDYVSRIKYQMSSSLFVICTLLKEMKEKYFGEESDEGVTWTEFCKERIGISRHAVASYLRIGKYVLPKITEELADKLGVKKLIELSKLENTDDWDEVTNKLHEDMSMKQVKSVVKEQKEKDQPELIKLKKKKTYTTLKKNIETLDADLREYLPTPGNVKEQDRFVTLANDLYNSMESLSNIMQMMKAVADE